MCGIAGYIWKDFRRPANHASVHAMSDMLSHRGPDDAGIFARGPVCLGHRRLSILDLSEAGHQPMVTHDGRYAITFNGEVYNYIELAHELELYGYEFRTCTDTEVILAAYCHWGADCVSRFNGMWAFAIYDSTSETVFLSRDRSGIKPLYYVLSNDALVFASEIKAIVSVMPELREPNLPYLGRFLTTGLFDDSQQTCFRRVISLLPAHNARFDLQSNAFQTWRYWQIDPEKTWQPEDGDPVEKLASLLESAVQLHMRSDVPVGTCLSGGIDSSTIVCLMSRLRKDPVLTFSGLYSDKNCNEKRYVDAINAHASSRSFPIFPEPNADLLEDLARITWHQDEPTAGPGLYTQFHVMRKASREVKVILDGQGADELFAGYLFYFHSVIQDLAASGAWLSRMAGFRLLLAIAWHWGTRSVPGNWHALLGTTISSLRSRLSSMRPRTQDVREPLLHPDLLRCSNAQQPTMAITRPFAHQLTNELYAQATATSLPALLHYEDRNSMAYSIEARVPLLDYRIIEFAFTLPSSYKLHGSWTKWVLRKAAEPLLPAQVAWRRSKLGYPTPMARWLRQLPDSKIIEDLLMSKMHCSRDLLNNNAIKRLWQEHLDGADHSWLLYRIITTELWHQHFIDNFRPCPATAEYKQAQIRHATRALHT